MSEQRPRQVTVAAWLIILGGAAVIVTAYQQMASLHSLATRESIQKELASAPFGGTSLGVGDILTAMHVMALVAGGCAAASVVLGWYALQGSRPARIGLSVIALPLLISGLAGGGVFSTLVAVAALLLWLPPAREWFRGEAPRGPAASVRPAPPAAPVPPGPPPAQPPVQPPAQPPAFPPPPTHPPYGAYPPYGPYPPYGSYPPGWQPGYPVRSTPPARRPGAVVTAAVLIWVFAALCALLMVASVAYVLSDQAGVWRSALSDDPNLAGRGITASEFAAMVCVMAALVVVWCAVTVVVAVFVWRGAAWARSTAMVLVSISLAGLVVSVFVSIVALVPAVAAVVTIVGLSRVEAREWCRR